LEKDGRKMPYKDQLAYCQENFNQSPSSSQISRVWLDRAKWLNRNVVNSDDNPKGKRVRGPKWEDLEKALALWVTQGEEEVDDEPVLPALPPILLVQAREAAATLSRFMAENADTFGGRSGVHVWEADSSPPQQDDDREAGEESAGHSGSVPALRGVDLRVCPLGAGVLLQTCIFYKPENVLWVRWIMCGA